jgi:hypothetical protein
VSNEKSFLTDLTETVDRHRQKRRQQSDSMASKRILDILRWFIPTGGTLILFVILSATQSVWAQRGLLSETVPSTNTISYQGRLADTSGNPLTGLYNLGMCQGY